MSLANASIVRLSNSDLFKAIHNHLDQIDVVAKTLAIQQIPAPTFHEAQRAAYLQTEFNNLGLAHVEVDDLHNVYGWLHGSNPTAPALVISAHTDTVFPLETDLTSRPKEDRYYGAGIGDNSLGVTGLVVVAELFRHFAIPQESSICFVANSREEGLGDLEGIKAVIERLGGRLGAAIVIEGMALGRIYHAGIAVRRYKISVTAPGGHSWLHFGNPSAIHRLMDFGAGLANIPLPTDPRTTYNIGLVEGGSSINTIASQAHCYLDLRSTDTVALQELEQRVRMVAKRHSQPEVTFTFEQVGDRPAGAIPESHPLVQLAKQAYQAVGITPEVEIGSTDANAFLARGIPAVCVGISFGANAHTLEEYIELDPIKTGLWQLTLLVAATANAITAWQ